jgi:hypothetical protein
MRCEARARSQRALRGFAGGDRVRRLRGRAARHLTKINRHNEHTYCTEDRRDDPKI